LKKKQVKSSGQPPAPLKPIHYTLLGLVILLVLGGCGPFSPDYDQNNEVRLAVYDYEVQNHGKPDDLVIHFYRTETKVLFEGQRENGGRTVWLFDLAAREYFDLLPDGRQYLYIQQIEFNNDRTGATVDIYRGDTSGYQGRTLTLVQKAGQAQAWQVVQEAAIARQP
jgi:hypothetical protein